MCIVDNRRVSIGARMWREGDTISIDGENGAVYGEAVEVRSRPAPEVSTLTGWARQLAIEIDGVSPDGLDDGARPTIGPPTTAAVLRTLRIRGRATIEHVARSLRCRPDALVELVAELTEAELVNERGSLLGLTEAGMARAAGVLAADSDAIGQTRAALALRDGDPIGERLKGVLGASQMRRQGGAHIRNDHSDTAYDASVAADLAGLQRDVAAWLDAYTGALPRLATYIERTLEASTHVSNGEPEWIASGRVDSYRDIWLALRQDLVLLAGSAVTT